MKPIARLSTLLLAAASAQAQPLYSITFIPPIEGPSGPLATGVQAMNEEGWIVGFYYTAAYGDPYGTRVALYRPGMGWQDIGHPGNLVTLLPVDITNDGTIVGYAGTSSTTLGGSGYAWSWKDGQFTLYPQLVPGRGTRPVPTSDFGRIVGYASNATVWRAVEFLPGSTVELLPQMPGQTTTIDINNHGTILGTDLQGIFLWPDQGQRWYFPPPSGLPYVDLSGMNDRNDVVGMARAEGHTETRTAVVWRDGAGWLALPRNARRCRAVSINNLREVVGWSQENAGTIGNHGWYWRPGMSGVTPLEYLLDAPAGTYAVRGVTQILQSGKILAGAEVRATGVAGPAVFTPIISAPLQLDLMSSVPPAFLPPGEPLAVQVRILEGTQSYTPGSAQVHYRPNSAAAFSSLPLQHVAGNTYAATLPGFSCGDAPQFYVSAGASGGGTITLPAGAPQSVFDVPMGATTTTMLIDESFESGVMPPGWSATGLWNVTALCNPNSTTCYEAGPTAAYYGIVGACNYNTGGRNAGNLTAPTVQVPAIAPGGEVRLTFCSSFFTDVVEGDATGRLYINDTLIDTLPWTGNWTNRMINLSQYAGQTITLEWRFDTNSIFGLNARGWHIDKVKLWATTTGCTQPACYANCDGSTAPPVLNVADFGCFLSKFAAGDPYANCDGSTAPPVLNVGDFGCFLSQFAAGCR